jgi:hypothetical protein
VVQIRKLLKDKVSKEELNGKKPELVERLLSLVTKH